ncbi:MAG: hypothetical protein EXR51_07855 [Dehalococcoidia bacterium]|nr:hypothetical protein [Dehalococcoidia bacterium]
MPAQTAHHIEDLLPAYLNRTLGAPDAALVEAHLDSCAACRDALAEWTAVGDAIRRVAVPAPSRGVLDRTFAKLDSPPPVKGWRRWPQLLDRSAFATRPVQAVLAASVLALMVLFTPLGSLAADLLLVFQPRQFVVVPVILADLQALPTLGQYGDLALGPGARPAAAADATAAQAASGIRPLLPAVLPPSVTGPAHYLTIPSHNGSFTFRAAKAQEAAMATGQALPPMPPNIDGTSVQMTTGRAVVTYFGSEIPLGGAPKAETSPVDPPQLVIVQAFVPTATSSGAPPKELQQYLLSLPGVSPELANAIRAIGDPTTMWPIPVPIGKIQTHNISIDGVPGTVFSDTSRFVTGVVWVKDGMVYAAGGPVKERELLAAAASLR